MSYLSNLCKTYDALERAQKAGSPEFNELPLTPIYHATFKAHVEIVINANGEFCHGQSRLLDKKGEETIIPCTLNSISRTSGTAPHPMFDQIKYMCKDLSTHLDDKSFGTKDKEEKSQQPAKTSNKIKDEKAKYDKKHKAFLQGLVAWDESPFSHWVLHAIRKYVERGTLWQDLVDEGLLFTENGMFRPTRTEINDKGKKKDVPSPLNIDSLIRIRVCDEEHLEDRPWKMSDLQDLFIEYSRSLCSDDKDYCYITGNLDNICRNAPQYIRYPGDACKIISSNDETNFTFRGPRATTSQDACVVGIEATFKSHNALKWLLAHQKCNAGNGETYVVWNHQTDAPLPDITLGTDDLFCLMKQTPEYDSGAEYANDLKMALSGYLKNKIHTDFENKNNDFSVIGLNSTSDKGRLSIIYYQALNCEEYAEKIINWHTNCSWLQKKTLYNDVGKVVQHSEYYGAPSFKDIISAAYSRGGHISEKQYDSALRRLMPCVLSGSSFPKDIMLTLSDRASNPAAYKSEAEFGNNLISKSTKQEGVKKETAHNMTYEYVLSIACSVIRKYYNEIIKNGNKITGNQKGEYTMSVDITNTNRSYLFGRLLAFYHWLEQACLKDKSVSRSTNAERYMRNFQLRPSSTANIIKRNLLSHERYAKCNKASVYGLYTKETDQIIDLLGSNFTDKRLDPTYLLGYSSQLNELRQYKKPGNHPEE